MRKRKPYFPNFPRAGVFSKIFNRTNLVFFLFIAMAASLIWKLAILQIEKGGYYEALALGQQLAFEENQNSRGNIFLQEGVFPLSQNKTKNILAILPSVLSEPEKRKEIDELAAILGEKTEDLMALLEKGEIIRKEITEPQLQTLKEKNYDFITLQKNAARFYPNNNFAANLLGFVNKEGKGQYGLEGYYDDFLNARSSANQKGRSPFGYLPFFDIFEADNDSSQKGADIWLTLDYKIQYFAEKLLKQAQDDWAIDSGQIIVAEPNSGKILALANLPDFNPNQYGEAPELGVFLNSAVQKTFEPGSIFKPITMAAGLEEDLVTPETKYQDKGYVAAGGPLIYNFGKRVWGESTMLRVLMQSINTGVIFVEGKLGKDMFLKYVKDFGFFEKTNIDLQGEVFSENQTLKNGYPRDFAVASFGQGIEVTPLQLIRAFGALANKGNMMKPYVVERIVNADGEEIITQPKKERDVISEETARVLTSMLVQVVEKGSASKGKISGYAIAGKTGTAQVALPEGGYSQEKTIQSFISYFPAFDPKYLVLIKLDNPKEISEASKCAVPLGRELIKNIIDLKQIPPAENEL